MRARARVCFFLRVLLCVAQTNSREFKRSSKKEREFFLFSIRAKFQRVFPTKAVKRDLFLLLFGLNYQRKPKKGKKEREKKGKRRRDIFCHTLIKNVEKKKCAGELIFEEEEEEAIFFLFKIRP